MRSGDVRLEVAAEPESSAGSGQASVERAFMSVQLQLLESCNLRCTHCYLGQPPPTRMPSTAEVERRLDLVHAFARAEGFEPDIHLSGGEPTLRRYLVAIVRHIFAVNEGDALLFTNGTRWNPELAQELWDAGLRYVQVSLEGPEALNDGVRGPGIYRTAMRTLELLAEAGFRRTVSITVTAVNFPVLFRFVEDLDAMDLHFHLREVFPVGAGANALGLSTEQRRTLSEWVIGWSGRPTVGLEDPVHCSVDVDYAGTRRGCVAGRNHFCVDVDGSVFPCRPLAHRVGHVDDLAGAWHSESMARLRRRELGGQCGRCDLLQNCGGCRVHALLDGDLFGEDRRCFAAELGAVRTPLEARAIDAAAAVGSGIWRARSTALRTLARWRQP